MAEQTKRAKTIGKFTALDEARETERGDSREKQEAIDHLRGHITCLYKIYSTRKREANFDTKCSNFKSKSSFTFVFSVHFGGLLLEFLIVLRPLASRLHCFPTQTLGSPKRKLMTKTNVAKRSVPNTSMMPFVIFKKLNELGSKLKFEFKYEPETYQIESHCAKCWTNQNRTPAHGHPINIKGQFDAADLERHLVGVVVFLGFGFAVHLLF